MKKVILFFAIFGVFILFGDKKVYAEDMNGNIEMLSPTNESKEGLPVYEKGGENEKFNEFYNNSIIKDFLRIYDNSFKYSRKESKKLNLIFKSNSGCYGGNKFYLKDENGNYKKIDENYIELSTGMLKRNGGIGGITEIFSHELGHVIYGMSAKSSEFDFEYGSNMHYSDVITSYHTAFNEGFAEHFQKIALKYEKNEDLKKELNEDLEIKKGYLGVIDNIKRDFNFPLRLEFFRTISPLWQSKYEEIKRLQYEGKIENNIENFKDLNKSISYKNMALDKNTKVKTYEKSISTELVISNFFYKLVDEGYGTLDDRYEKIVKVFSKYLNDKDTPEIIQFVKGYITEYPEEKDRVLKEFKDSVGHDFTDKFAKEIYLTSDEKYSSSTMDQYGASLSNYKFNLNVCDYIDLMTLGLNKDGSQSVIDYRDNNGAFNSILEIDNIEDLSRSDKDKILKAYNKQGEFNEGVDFKNILCKNFIHLLFQAFMWFLIFLIPLVIIEKRIFKFKDIIKLFMKYVGFIIIGLISALAAMNVNFRGSNINPWIVYCIIILVIQILRMIIIRRNIRNSLISTILFSSIIIYSLI